MNLEKQINLNDAWEICEWTQEKSLSQKVWRTMLDIWKNIEKILDNIFDCLTKNWRKK